MHKSGVYTFGFLLSLLIVLAAMQVLNQQQNIFLPNTVAMAQEYDNYDDNKDLFTLNIKMNLNNIQLKNGDKIKIVAYLNGETEIRYIDPQKEKNQITGNFLTVEMKFNKTNEIISSIGQDEYFVCAYVLNNGNGQTILSNNRNASAITYDCDEGQTVEGKDVSMGRLFNTMKKFQKTLELSQIAQKSNQSSGDVKITVITPIYDQTDVELLNVIAMVKGEYQVKTVNIENELKKAGDKSDESYIIKVPFTFDRNTELGTIEKGDIFFGCASAEELGPPQMTECEKKYIKDFDKPNNIVTRHEEDLLPGQEWKREIPKAVRRSDVVIVCLSHTAINKRGYVQKEIKIALDIADEQPEGTIYIIPLKLEQCEVPERLSHLQWVDFFKEEGYRRLVRSLETALAKFQNLEN